VHDGILPSHLIFFFRHISQACSLSASCHRVCAPQYMYPCNAPSLWVAIIVIVHIIVCEHRARRHLGGVERAAAEDARRRVHHGRAGGIEAILGGIHRGLGVAVSSVVEFVRQFVPRGNTRGEELFCDAGLCGSERRRGLVLRRMKRCRGYHPQGRGGGCRRLTDYRIASGTVRMKLVWQRCIACWI
jgi:hypothetical protein